MTVKNPLNVLNNFHEARENSVPHLKRRVRAIARSLANVRVPRVLDAFPGQNREMASTSWAGCDVVAATGDNRQWMRTATMDFDIYDLDACGSAMEQWSIVAGRAAPPFVVTWTDGARLYTQMNKVYPRAMSDIVGRGDRPHSVNYRNFPFDLRAAIVATAPGEVVGYQQFTGRRKHTLYIVFKVEPWADRRS